MMRRSGKIVSGTARGGRQIIGSFLPPVAVVIDPPNLKKQVRFNASADDDNPTRPVDEAKVDKQPQPVIDVQQVPGEPKIPELVKTESIQPTQAVVEEEKKEEQVVEEEEEKPPKFPLVRPFTLKREVIKFRLLRCENPFEFYLVDAEDLDECFILSGGFEHLQKVAENMKLYEERWRPKKLIINMTYVIFDVNLAKWHRCLLLSFKENSEDAEVFYLDYYWNAKKVMKTELKEMPSEIAAYPITTTYKCHLYDIIPANGSHVWDKETIRQFRNHVVKPNKEVLMGLPMSWNVKQVGGYDILVEVGIILFENARDDARVEGTINWKLVATGNAKPIGIGGLHFSNLFFHEPAFSLEGAPETPVPEPFLKPFPYEAGRRLPQVVITSIRGLDCIYVRLVSKHAELKAMEHSMQSEMTPRQKLPKELLKVGTPVLCMEIVNVNGVFAQKRSRGVIVKTFEGGLTSVLQVDTGFLLKLPLGQLFEMPKKLTKIPAFAHRIHLSNMRPKCGPHVLMIKWDPEGRAPLQEFLQNVHDRLNPAFFAVRSSARAEQDVVALNEIHQPLAFYIPEKTWTPVHTGREHLILKAMPMLESYFHSFGADVQIVGSETFGFIVGGERKEVWNFQSLSRLLVDDADKFDAELIQREEMDKESYYKALFEKKSDYGFKQ